MKECKQNNTPRKIKRFKKALVISLALAYMCIATACNRGNNNDTNSGSMAGTDAPTQNENNTGVDDNNAVTDENNAGTGSGSVLDEAGNAIGNVVDDVADGVSDVTNDLVGNGDNNTNNSAVAQ